MSRGIRTPDLVVAEILRMSKEGHSPKEISEATGIGYDVVRRYRAMHGIPNNTRLKGSPRAKGLLIPPNGIEDEKEEKKEMAQEQNKKSATVVADQTIRIAGIATANVYAASMHKDTISIEGENLVGEIKIEMIPKLMDELRDVYVIAKGIKKGV